MTPSASAYFGAASGEVGKGYYSYDAGAWHVVVLNSERAMTPCAAGSAQERWLRADLAANAGRCTLAYWHRPYWSSGLHGGDASVGPFVHALYEAGADVILAGHDHDYERFAPPDPEGVASARGLREFVVGTSGASPYPFVGVRPNSEKRLSGVFGVLRLVLSSGGYAWSFIDTDGHARDDGAASCEERRDVTRVVVLADTHIPGHAKALPAELVADLRRADLILHAGDVTSSAVLDELASYAPVQSRSATTTARLFGYGAPVRSSSSTSTAGPPCCSTTPVRGPAANGV